MARKGCSRDCICLKTSFAEPVLTRLRRPESSRIGVTISAKSNSQLNAHLKCAGAGLHPHNRHVAYYYAMVISIHGDWLAEHFEELAPHLHFYDSI